MRAGLLTLAALAAAPLVAPAVAAAQERVEVWHAYRGEEEEGLRAAAAAFMRASPDVRVRLVAQPFGAYASKLESAIPTGNGPDLFIDTHDRVASYVAASLIVAVEPADRAAFEARIEPAHRAALTIEGALRGYPLSVKAPALYVNTAFVAGEVEALEDLAALSLPSGVYPLVMEAQSAYWVSGLFGAYGAGLVDEDGGWGLGTDGATRALEQLRGLVEAGVIPRETDGALVARLFTAGRAASAISGPWLAPDLPPELRWRVQPLPIVRGAGGEPMRPYVTVEGAFVASRARAPDGARRFAEFLMLGEGALLRARRARQVVTDEAAWASLEDDAFLRGFRRAARQGRVTPTHPHMRMAYVPADRAIRKVLRGTFGAREALAEGGRRFDDVTRALPAPVEPAWGLLALGLLMLGAIALSIRRLREAPLRAAIKQSLPAYRYVAHAAIAVGLLVILPLVVGAATSFFAGRGTDMYFVGLANYADILSARGGDLFGNGSFWLVLLVTVLWTAANVGLHVVIGVALALLLYRPYLRLKGVYRVLLIIPWAVPNYVTALAWRGMFHFEYGAVNTILERLGLERVSWFASWVTAFGANVATNVWLGFPFMMVVTLGALTSIPKDVYEAAAVDGANAWQRFRHITLPLLGPFLAPAVAMGSVWTFNMFNVVYLVSGGEPDGGTEILVSEAYRWAFTRGNQYGYAAAYAVLIFVILVIGTRLTARAAEARA
ncbi:MAG: extracellular solute-binding protein [Sandaracinaceae bacterium]|nr:extracellular solute-binding protein [Sandaracinaceae bacterium]